MALGPIPCPQNSKKSFIKAQTIIPTWMSFLEEKVKKIKNTNVTQSRHYAFVYLLGITRPGIIREWIENRLYMPYPLYPGVMQRLALSLLNWIFNLWAALKHTWLMIPLNKTVFHICKYYPRILPWDALHWVVHLIPVDSHPWVCKWQHAAEVQKQSSVCPPFLFLSCI